MAKHRYLIDGQAYEVEVHARSARSADVSVNGRRYRVEQDASAAADAPVVALTHSALAPRAKARPGSGELRAPMAGLVARIAVSLGQEVAAGEPVLILDAMKMENAIRSPHSGVVEEIAVAAGETVLTGALLLRVGKGARP